MNQNKTTVNLPPFNELPGYREAVERELEVRSQPFVSDWPEFICGIEVRPLTRNLLAKLHAAKCAFVCGGEPAPEDAILFLWIVSPNYRWALRWKDWIAPWSEILADGVFDLLRKKFQRRRLRWTSHGERMAGIWEYLGRMFFDSGGVPKNAEHRPLYFSGCALRVAHFAKEFGWTAEEIMNLPLPCEFQLSNWLESQADPRKILWNPLSDKARRVAIEALMEGSQN